MANFLPRWLIGRHITAVTIIPCTVNATTGAVTEGTGTAIATLRGRVDSVRVLNPVGEEIIMSVDSALANHVLTYDDFQLELAEILVNSQGTTPAAVKQPILPQVPTLGDLFRIVFGRGGQTYSSYMTRGQLGEGVTATGKNTATMTFSLADVKVGDSGDPLLAPSYGVKYFNTFPSNTGDIVAP